MITGWSFLVIESAASLPTPLIPNTVSVISAPPSRPAKSIPAMVTTGVSAGRSACRRHTRSGRSPLAFAVRTKFSARVSMTLARVSRVYAEAYPIASTVHGSTKLRNHCTGSSANGTACGNGSHCNCTTKTNCRASAST
jgi:hypothetical protein